MLLISGKAIFNKKINMVSTKKSIKVAYSRVVNFAVENIYCVLTIACFNFELVFSSLTHNCLNSLA